MILGAVGLPPAVLLELAAVVLHPLIGPGPERVGVAGALLGDLGPAPHISSPGRRRGRSAGGRLGPVGGYRGQLEEYRRREADRAQGHRDRVAELRARIDDLTHAGQRET